MKQHLGPPKVEETATPHLIRVGRVGVRVRVWARARAKVGV